MGDGHVLGLARPGGDDGAQAGAAGRVEGGPGLGHRAGLVRLDEEGVAGAVAGGALDARGVGHEVVVADHLHAAAHRGREPPHAGVVVLGQRVLDGDDGIAVDPAGQQVAKAVAVHRPALEAEVVAAVPVELGGGDVEGDRHLVAGDAPAVLDGPHEELEGLFVGVEGGPPAPLVGDALQASGVGHARSRRPVDLRRPVEGLGEAGRADRHHHEVLDVHPPPRVSASAEDLDLGQRQQRRFPAQQVSPQRLSGGRGGGVQRRHRDRDAGVAAQPALVRRAVEVDQDAVEPGLIGRVAAAQGGGDAVPDVPDGAGDVVAAEGVAAVAQVHRLAAAGRGAGRRRRAAADAAGQVHLGLDGGAAAGVPYASGEDASDAVRGSGHRRSSLGIENVMGRWVRSSSSL